MKNEIYIGITGNRDISEEQIVFIKERIEEFLSNCQKDNEFVELIVLTPLADGVDRIIANSILEYALSLNQNRAGDDMTIAVMSIRKKTSDNKIKYVNVSYPY